MTEEEKKAIIITEIVAKGDRGELLSKDEQHIYKTHKKVVKEESSWIARNAWWIIVGIVLFIIKMCSDISK